MASISRDGKGWILQFCRDGKRPSVRLGRMPKNSAESVKTRVELLLAAQQSGEPLDGETARWVGSLGDKLHERLARVGVVSVRARATLGAFLDSFIREREGSRKPGTAAVWRAAQRDLIEFFTADKPLRDISAGDADSWRAWLSSTKGLADNTANRRAGHAKQFLRAAVRLRLIPENPFQDLTSAVRGTPQKFRFIDRATVAAVLDACPDAEMRLIIVLSRFGGLRVPSEIVALRWGGVNWEHNRMTIRSPKTEHHAGHESRVIPLFPELKPHLEAAFFSPAAEGSEHVIGPRLTPRAMWRALERAIVAAGAEPWPRPWHNMRATRQTELSEQFPAHVVSAWLGNSERVAREHYLHTTDEHFARAVEGRDGALQKRMQYTPEQPRAGSGDRSRTPVFPETFEGVLSCTNVHGVSV